MAPKKKTLAGTVARPQIRELHADHLEPLQPGRHEAEYPDRPKFTAEELSDWTRIYQRVDVEHPKPGRNSFQALVGRQVIGRDHVTHTAVYFVAYTKDHRIIEVISIRFADSFERAIFLR